jgi:hypothetical protein
MLLAAGGLACASRTARMASATAAEALLGPEMTAAAQQEQQQQQQQQET